MEAPKPDEDIPAWKYLDIFVFSNGQENSPPRKYHLVSDYLEIWPDTLKELAQEQFGSLDNNINLYTTQGRLIKTPLELNHNKAYVAVRSPEEFIDAGYDRYLLRAIRSWEKRQDKRSYNTAEKPGEDLMTGKSDHESITALTTIVPSTVDNLDSLIVKSRDRNTSISTRNPIKRSSLSKKNYNVLSTVKSTRTPTQRREATDETADESTPSKSPFRGRVHNVFQKRRNSEAVVSKVEEDVNQLENSSPRNVEQTNARTKRDENRSRMTKPVENETDQRNKLKPIPHMIGNRPRILMTKPVENEKDQQRAKVKPFSNSIENRNRHTMESGENVKIEQTKPKMMPHLKKDQLDTEVVDPNFDAEQHIKENKQKSGDKSDTVSKAESYLTKNNDDLLKKKDTPPATSTVKNNLSNLSKGIINMRIEVYSSEATRNASCEIKAPLIIVTNEIGSQVDMAGQTGQNKGLHQVIASDKDGIEGNYKVILVRSSYPNNSTCESGKNSVIGEFVMFLPVIKLDELYCRCSGCETNDCLGENSSVINPVKKTASCISIHKENANRISIDPVIHHDEIRHDSTGQNLYNDTIQDKTEPLEQKLSKNDTQFEESKVPIASEFEKVKETNQMKMHATQPETKESKISKFSENKVPIASGLEKVKETNQIKMHATQPETKASKISKFSESQVPIASDFEKVKETKTELSVEIIHSTTDELNINATELSSAYAKSGEVSKYPSATSLVSKRTGIRETEESTVQFNSEMLTKALAVAEATSLLETRLEPANQQAFQDKASQTEWTDMLWEAQLQEDGHYSFHLPALSRLKEYNL